MTKRLDVSSISSDKKQLTDLNLLEDGIQIIRGYIPKDVLKNINEELDSLFKNFALNKFLNASAILNNNLSELTKPTSLDSINILENIIDVYKLINIENNLSNYICTNIEIFSEKNNPRFLPYHTDQRKGMIRAQIYLKGGGEKSGAFKYMRGTHKLEHNVTHHLNEKELNECNHLIVDTSGNAGDLIIFDTFGFHGKNICTDERRTMMIEFQPKDSDFSKSSISLCNRKLTNKVINHLSLFYPGDENTYGNHGLDGLENDFRTFGMLKLICIQFISQKLKNILKRSERYFQ